jgi:hypothetical protein
VVTAHTLGQLLELRAQQRIARGEPEDGAVATDAEALRWARKVRREAEREARGARG